MRDLFAHFYALDKDTVKAAVQGGLVAPDTNVLLNLYRFQGGAREDLFGALEILQDRLWIPHQVGLEFQRRRIGVIADQEQYFTSTQRDIKQLIDSIRDKAEAFPKRIGLDKERTQEILHSIGSISAILNEEISKAGRANEVRLKNSDSDKVLKRLEALVDGRIGKQMAPAEFQAARAEALRRVEAGLPPGYEDDGKADPTGDYLVFKQLMNEAKQRKLPVVLVTDDEKKDWYRREQGKPLGARPELREEMMTEAGVPFVIITTETFLRHVKAHLDFDVSSDTIDQAKELPGVLEEHKRMLAMRRDRAAVALTNIRLRRTDLAQEAAVATARERAIRGAIARGDSDGNSTERLRGELEARLTDRMVAETRLSAPLPFTSRTSVAACLVFSVALRVGHDRGWRPDVAVNATRPLL
jgi:hypothetical protein